jgi:hypothetical protein
MSRTAFYQQTVKQEQLHEKQALEISKEALEHYEIAYSLCHEILFELEENVDLKDDPDRRAVSEIFIRLLGTMQSIKWLLLKGYYFDASVLKRSFLEGLGDCCYIHQNKGTGEKWFKDEKKYAKTRASNKFIALIKTLKREIPSEDTMELYRKLFKYVHGNSSATMTLISEVEDEYDLEESLSTIYYSVPSRYDKCTVDNIAILSVMVLSVIQELFPELSDYDKKQIAESQKQPKNWG